MNESNATEYYSDQQNEEVEVLFRSESITDNFAKSEENKLDDDD